MPNATLTKKVGPLPAWAWVAGGLLFVGMVWYMRRNASDSSTPAPVDNSALAPDTGIPVGAGSGYDGVSGGGSLYGSDVTYADTGTPVGYPPDFLSGLLANMNPYGSSSPIYESPTAPYQTQPSTLSGGTQTVTSPTATKQTSFQWGGRTWTSKDQAAFRAWLKAHGVSYAQWATNHPKAAMDVFGTMK